MSRMKAVGLGMPGRVARLAAAALGAAALALAGASVAAAEEVAYVSNGTENAVTAIHLTSNATETINVEMHTSSIAASGELAWVTGGPHWLTGLMLSEKTTLTPVNVECEKKSVSEPEDVAIDGEFAYVADEEANCVVVVNVKTNAVVAEIKVGEEPEGIAITPNGEFAYVADKASEKEGTVTVIEKANKPTEAKVKETIEIGSGVEPEKVAITPNGELALVAEGEAGKVDVIEIKKANASKTITVGSPANGEPNNVAITPNGDTAWVTDGTAQKVVSIELNKANKLGEEFSVGKEPHGLAASNEWLVVANEEATSVDKFENAAEPSKAKLAHTFTVAGEPDGVAITTP